MTTTDRILGEAAPTFQAAKEAFDYARDTVKGPFPAGEVAIAQDPDISYHYAHLILGGPFPAGELAIAKKAWLSLDYARNVLHGPFPAGEPAIAKDPHVALIYARSVLKARFPACERRLATSDLYQSLSELYLGLFPEAKEEWAACGWIDWF